MNPIRIGLIGFGRMGGFYLEELRKSGKWEVAYICDICAESRDLAHKLAPEARIVADEQLIFDDPTVQVVGLFALADSRKTQIEKAFAAGKHVIAEKPISDSVENEWKAVEMAESTPLFSTVNLYLRNSWYHNTIKDFIAQGEIGELAIVRVCHMTPGLAPGEGHEYEGPSFHDCAGTPVPSSKPGTHRPYACGTTRTPGGSSVTARSKTASCSTSPRGMSTDSWPRPRPTTPMSTSSARRASPA